MGLITDPRTGDSAEVANGRLKVSSISEALLWDKLIEGKAFYVSTGVNCYFGGGSSGITAGTYTASEYVVAELYNNTDSDLMIIGAECSLSKPHTVGPYTPHTISTHDVECRFNQWLYAGSKLSTSGSDAIVNNLNRTSTEELETRSNGNKAMRVAKSDSAISTPGSSDAGYICGFKNDYTHGKVQMLTDGQPLIIGRGQSWLVSLLPMQNSTPTNLLFNVRASVIKL